MEYKFTNHKEPQHTHTLPIENRDIINSIKTLKDRAPGMSGIRKPYFSNLPPNIITNICHLFNCCYATGLYPKHFKTAEIIMIPKTKTPSPDPTQYRPISLLNILGKIFAKIINNKLVEHLENNNIIRESLKELTRWKKGQNREILTKDMRSRREAYLGF